jgi:hypothetical protein
MTQHPYDEIEAFALGSLDDAAARALLDHADACPTCAVLLADAMAGVGALASLEAPRPVTRTSPDIGVTVLRPRRPVSTWVAGAAIAACLGLILWNVQLRNEAVSVPIGALVHSHFVHHPLTGKAGDAKVLQAADGRWVYVVADGLSPHAHYALWETRGGTTAKVGELVADGRGDATRYFEQPAGQIDGFALTGADKTPASDTLQLRWP